LSALSKTHGADHEAPEYLGVLGFSYHWRQRGRRDLPELESGTTRISSAPLLTAFARRGMGDNVTRTCMRGDNCTVRAINNQCIAYDLELRKREDDNNQQHTVGGEK